MKKIIKISVLIIVSILIIVSAFVIFSYSDTITLKNRLEMEEVEIFVPDGRADKYKDLLEFTFDTWCIYEYKLTEKEIDKVEKDLAEGLWRKLSEDEKVYFVKCVFDNPSMINEKWQDGFDLSDEAYICEYSGYKFIYDRGNSSFYGIYIRI